MENRCCCDFRVGRFRLSEQGSCSSGNWSVFLFEVKCSTRDATKIAKVIKSIFVKDRFVSRRSRENEEKRRGKSKSTLHAFNLSLSLRKIEISFGW